jgi:hypothetical protein
MLWVLVWRNCHAHLKLEYLFRRDGSPTRSRRSMGSGGETSNMLTTVEGNAVQASRAFITELETSIRTKSKRMTNRNTPQFSRMDLANHCPAFPELLRLNTRAVLSLGLILAVQCIRQCIPQWLAFVLVLCITVPIWPWRSKQVVWSCKEV